MKSSKIYFQFTFLFWFCLSFSQNSASVQLPPPQTEIGKPLMQVLKLRQSSRSFETTALPMQELSNLLWAAYGINRPETGKRTAPSAMNWQEIDIYVVLKDGAYIYEVQSHSLTLVSTQDLREATGKQLFVQEAPVNLVFIADGMRMSRVGEEEKLRWSSADAGFIAQNVYLYCASQGLAVVVRGMVDRESLAKELKLRPEQKIVLCQTVGYSKQ
jgi:SagB-type dehydrogenase family enzyme